MDVRTGYCRQINLQPFGLGSKFTQIGANSKYLVVVNRQVGWSKIGIFDLYAAGEKTGEGCNSPLSLFDVRINIIRLQNVITFYVINPQVPFKVIRFEMDETALIFVGKIPNFDTSIVVIDFLSTPSNMDTGTTSSGSLSNGDGAMWRFKIAKEISETLL